MEPLHLWWNGNDHAPGANEDDATRWLMAETGLDADDCRGDWGWQMVADETVMLDGEGPDAPPVEPRETAIEVALSLVARRPIPARPAA